ncbi:hypothetical protein LCM23_06355 [Cytobacillus kochii]|uniref:hypothetical protein n=1 Tax=Cytobacillus kochii TaxID=859143 RepID=UPI001CD72F8B|nr:hypothetical protein [Cytobacillus kochii]MCA1025707.1 hypothetical protein [Cytobacillus kochii]
MLTNEQLENLTIKRNKENVKHTVDVMNNEELKSYRENCVAAIERQEDRIKKAKLGSIMQKIAIETKEELEGYVAYIDAVTSEKMNADAVIDQFLANWKENVFNYYLKMRKEYEAIRGSYNERMTFLNKVTKADYNMIVRYSESMINKDLDKDVRHKKMKFYQTITKKAGNILEVIEMYLGSNGEINGIIKGDKETVRIETITAGGYNIQKAHFRVLVKKKKF